MRLITLLFICVVAVSASVRNGALSPRIVGSNVTTINKWPSIANLMEYRRLGFEQYCGGVIINNRSILTAAHCVLGSTYYIPPSQIRIRLGSSFDSRGVDHNVQQHIIHPAYNLWTLNSDIMTNGPRSDQLREVQVWSINQQICGQRYRNRENPVTMYDNMMCSGYLDVGGRDSCQGDSGGPVYHDNVVVGITSFGDENCADPYFPGQRTCF